MKITKRKLELAADENIITREQVEKLYSFLGKLPSTGPGFNFTNILYYMGGLVAIGAMTLFMNLGWEQFGGFGILLISIIYAFIGLFMAKSFQKKGFAVPAGICATFAVALTPLAIYGFQHAMGWWEGSSHYREYHIYIKYNWIYMEAGTLVAASVIAYFFRYPFLQMPVAVTLWYMSMDLAALLSGGHLSFAFRAQVSMYFGLGMILLAFLIDFKASKNGDYAFWIYLFGVIAFWGGMTSQNSHSELSKFIYLCINIAMIGFGVVIVRKVFVVFGALGCSFYLGHLANEIFKDSWLFPIALTFIGLGIIYLGILWQKNEKRINKKVRGMLPSGLRTFIETKEA